MLITALGLLIVVAAAFFVAWPLIVPTGDEARPAGAGDLGESSPLHDKELALAAIRDADFDHRTGKLSDEDYAALRGELEERALRAMAAIDEASVPHPVAGAAAPASPPARTAGEPGGFCPACGVRFARGARFCPGCGKKLPAAAARGRRRA
jgi:hypothetical protein